MPLTGTGGLGLSRSVRHTVEDLLYWLSCFPGISMQRVCPYLCAFAVSSSYGLVRLPYFVECDQIASCT